MLLVAAIRAVLNQDAAQLMRSFFVYLPVAILGAFIAIFLTRTMLAVTDAMSGAVADGIAGDVTEIFDAVGTGGLGTADAGAPTAPSFAIFFAALFLIVGSFFVWLELLVRSAAVTVSAFFLPLVLATLVWPATSRWTRRLAETLVALILSKFVIVAVISLATAALAEPGGGGFGSVMGAAALMLMAAFSPVALLKLLPLAEGAAISHLEGVGRKPVEALRSGGPVNHAAAIMRSRVGAGASSLPTRQGGMANAAARVTPAGAAVTAGLGAARAVARSATEPRAGGGADTPGLSRSADTSVPAQRTRPLRSASSAASRPPRRDRDDGGSDG